MKSHLFSQRRRVVDRNLLKIWVLTPELVQNQQQLLSTTQGKHRNQTTAALHHNLLHQRRESVLSVLPLLVDVCAVGGFSDEDIRSHVGDLGGHQMPILLTGEVSGVQNLHAGDFNHEHRGTENVTGWRKSFRVEFQWSTRLLTVIRPEANAHHVTFLVEIDRLDFLHARLQIGLGVEH
jgi:hypothetical protein